ncbi:hypothetical protein [Streptomyces sp. bgisy100]|uniref:hypothetical protein n=1 Tax=Streptomyces sp. bgisy100 TaxID=3413783 RepID=UPI003D71C620
MLGRTEEADAEARRAYTTEQNRRWYKHNPTGSDAVAAARKHTAEYLLTVRVEQQTVRTEQAAPRCGQTGCPSSPRARWTTRPGR